MIVIAACWTRTRRVSSSFAAYTKCPAGSRSAVHQAPQWFLDEVEGNSGTAISRKPQRRLVGAMVRAGPTHASSGLVPEQAGVILVSDGGTRAGSRHIEVRP